MVVSFYFSFLSLCLACSSPSSSASFSPSQLEYRGVFAWGGRDLLPSSFFLCLIFFLVFLVYWFFFCSDLVHFYWCCYCMFVFWLWVEKGGSLQDTIFCVFFFNSPVSSSSSSCSSSNNQLIKKRTLLVLLVCVCVCSTLWVGVCVWVCLLQLSTLVVACLDSDRSFSHCFFLFAEWFPGRNVGSWDVGISRAFAEFYFIW